MELATSPDISSNGHAPCRGKRAPRPKYTAAEKKLYRGMLARGTSREIVLVAMRKVRPWANKHTVENFIYHHGKRLRSGAGLSRPVVTQDAVVTIAAGTHEPVSFKVNKKTARAVIELLVGV